MIKLKSLVMESAYSYGCVMAEISTEIADRILQFGQKLIPDDVLYYDPTGQEEFGREKEPHVTIKFGLKESYTEHQMLQFLSGTKPFYLSVQKLSIFSNPKFDVVKFDVTGDAELYRIRSIFDGLPNADEHKDYHPHLTLAYVKPGMGSQFIKTGRAPSRLLVNRIKYSDKGNRKLYFVL